jgi:hypothetical protein
MFIATIVLGVLLAAAFLGSGGAKLAAAEQSIEIRDRLGVAAPLWRGIGIHGRSHELLKAAPAVALVLMTIAAAITRLASS